MLVATQRRVYCNATMNSRKGEYYTYLLDHINGVSASWHNVLKAAMKYDDRSYDPNMFQIVDELVEKHDESKYEDIEFTAYCDFFYPDPDRGFPKDQEAFDAAWLHHIHNNPHHPQHWILRNDDGTEEILDMPIEYICEMLCDWHSFSYKEPRSTAYRWYQDNKNRIQLSDNTREEVEYLIQYLKVPITTLWR